MNGIHEVTGSIPVRSTNLPLHPGEGAYLALTCPPKRSARGWTARR